MKLRRMILMLLGVFIIGTWISMPVRASASSGSSMDDIDYSDIQNALNYALEGEETLDFKGYVTDLTTGEEPLSFSGVLNKLLTSLGVELRSNMTGLLQLLTIAVIAAVFTNFSHTFQNSQVADTGFYVTYLMMFVILASTFITAASIASGTLSKILTFMKALVPAYCMSVAFCTGGSTSAAYYAAILGLVTLVDFLLIKVVLPLINIYMISVLGNNLTSEDMLSKLADLLSTVVKWILKTLLAVVVGIGTIQSLIAPAIDQVKRSAVLKATDAIPGVGGILSGVAETVLGAGVLLKNCIGVAGIVALLVICVVPMIKLLVYVVIYKLLAAAIQPISDKRIVNCVSSSAEAASLLLQTVFVSLVLFEIAITIVAVSTMKAY